MRGRRSPAQAERLAATRAAERVYEVKAVANDLKVQFSWAPRDDSDIATAIAYILEWNVQIPEGKVHARVENGWVTLAGEVDYDYQRREVERMVNHVRGVAGVQNFIIVRPPASPEAAEVDSHLAGNALASRPSERAGAAAAGAGPGAAAARSGGGAGTCVPACSPRART